MCQRTPLTLPRIGALSLLGATESSDCTGKKRLGQAWQHVCRTLLHELRAPRRLDSTQTQRRGSTKGKSNPGRSRVWQQHTQQADIGRFLVPNGQQVLSCN
jgi:hypothetical protein